MKIAARVPTNDGGYFVVLHRDTRGMAGAQAKFLMRTLKGGVVPDYGTQVSVESALQFAKNRSII